MIMLFVLLAGRHVHNGVEHVKDDVIETGMNLVEMFGDNKFRRAVELEATRPLQEAPAASAQTAGDEKGTTTPEANELGVDVTDDFGDARVNGILVFKKQETNKKGKAVSVYSVIDTDNPGVVVNNKPLHKKLEVQEFIDSLFE
jgi:hypothetical protein